MNSFFRFLYELLYSPPGFSNDLFNEGVYAASGMCILISSLVFVVMFYYIIRRPAFARWTHWLFMGILNSLLCSIFAYFSASSSFAKADIVYDDGTTYLITFTLSTALLALLPFYIAFSFVLRWWSKHASRTPIPN
jgi:hypothetical protein